MSFVQFNYVTQTETRNVMNISAHLQKFYSLETSETLMSFTIDRWIVIVTM